MDVVQAIQSTSLTLQKAKDSCTQKGLELDKLKKESASPKELEKAELKLKKAQEEYKILVEKYSAVKEDFEKKMSLACRVRNLNLCFIMFSVYLIKKVLINFNLF